MFDYINKTLQKLHYEGRNGLYVYSVTHTTLAVGFATYRAMLVCSQQKTKKPLQNANAEKGPSKFFFATMS